MQYQSLLNIIIELLRNSSGGTSSVDITGNSAGIATGANITTLQNTLNTTLGNLLTQLSAINGNTDLIETLQTNTNNLLTLTNSYVDGVEGLLTALGNNTDNLETLLTALGLNTDDLENLITTSNSILGVIATLNTDMLNNLTQIKDTQKDGTQITKIRDTAGQELNINADGSLNVLVPANLVRESSPLFIQNDINQTRGLVQEVVSNTYHRVNKIKGSFDYNAVITYVGATTDVNTITHTGGGDAVLATYTYDGLNRLTGIQYS